MLLAAVEARELLVAERHHVVRREDDRGARALRLGEAVVAEVGVHEVRVHDVGLPLGEDRGESAVDAPIVQRDPRPEADAVVRVDGEALHPLDDDGRGLRGVTHAGDDGGLVPALA